MRAVVLLISAAVAIPVSHVPSADSQGTGFGSAKHVLIVGVDGFGGMYLENATDFLPTFKRIMDSGSWTTRARNQMPTISAPNWNTIITGMPPEESGVFNNDWTPDLTNVTDPTDSAMPPISGAGKVPEPMWAVLKKQNPSMKVAVSISWDWINYLVENSTVDYLCRAYESDETAANGMIDFIENYKPNLMFIHMDDVDEAGHASYWGSEKYYNATKEIDQYLASMLGALDDAGIAEDTLVLMTADHGGWGSSHGQNNMANFYIPLLFYGAGIRSHSTISSFASNRDISATVMYALGLQPGPFFQGRVLHEIFAGEVASN